jgi:DNA-binding PadR family transcriptional regulator
VAPSKVYVTLRRLENRSLVRSRLEPRPADEGGRERRFFTLEPTAPELLEKSKQVFSNLWEDLPVLDQT